MSWPPPETGWSVRITCSPIRVSTFLPPGKVTIISLDMRSLLVVAGPVAHDEPARRRRARDPAGFAAGRGVVASRPQMRAKTKAKPVSRAALAGEADPRLVALSVSIQDDGALYAEDIRGSQAHVTMLAAQGIVPKAAARRIVAALDQVRAEFAAGKIRLDPALEDVHTHVERRLGELVGGDAGYLHAGRSRNDQVALDERLFIVAACDRCDAALGAAPARARRRGARARGHHPARLHPPAARAADLARAPPARLRRDARARPRPARRCPAARGDLAARLGRARRDDAPARSRGDRGARSASPA